MDEEDFLEDEEAGSLGDFDLDDQEDFDENIPPPPAPEKSVAEPPPPPVAEPAPEPEPVVEEAPEPAPSGPALVSAAELPVQLKVELGRLHMTADKLLHLQPGNFLELARGVDQRVDLVVNGECVGRGELIRIGDVVGVRVTQLG